ncbi:DUF7556 family protein [Halosimplex amylolyticum]|uniref:DUF7556 family protein n=1 Tax=Halosimplex amylolyticum TaxID=3396616 RepID=UPI003F559B15
MSTDARSCSWAADGPEIVATVDEADGSPRFVVADIARDEAWVSASASKAYHLDEWR